jgi:hypothetical protein
MTQLEQDIIDLCQDNKYFQPFQLGGFIICPIYCGVDQEGVVQVDRESMIEDLEQTLDVLDLTYLYSE